MRMVNTIVSSLCIILIVLSIVPTNVQGYVDHCVKQYFNQNSFVCVCNQTDCDSIEASSLAPNGYVAQWKSSIDKYRLHRSEISVKSLPINPLSVLGPNVTRVRLNSDDRRQKIIGFGGGVTDSVGFVLSSLPINLRDHIMLDYFSETGIGYSILRVTIAGTDFSSRAYTYDDNHNDDFDLVHFQLQREDTHLKIPIIKRAQELSVGPIKLLGSSWSPPAWMKTNNDIKGSGALKGSAGGPYYKTWAKYFVKFLDEYAKRGVNFWGLTTGNEPTIALRRNNYYNCLGMTPEQLRDFIKLDLGPILRDSGYGKDKLELLMFDEVREYIVNYTDVVLSDSEAASYIAGIAFHWYETNGKLYYENLDVVREKFPKHFLLGTEACEGFERYSTKRSQLGNWTRAEDYAKDILQDLNKGSTGWMDWNIALNIAGGPTYVDSNTDGLILVDADRQTYYRNPMFYAIAHFSKFIKPGSVYISYEIDGDKLIEGVNLAAFVDPSDQLIVVIVNTNHNPVDLIIDNFAEGPVPITMDPHSIQTLITQKL